MFVILKYAFLFYYYYFFFFFSIFTNKYGIDMDICFYFQLQCINAQQL